MDNNYQEFLDKNNWQLEHFIEAQNKHIFGDKPKTFGDGFYEVGRFSVEDADNMDDCDWLFPPSAYKHGDDKVKSWIYNLDSKASKLVIDDLDDGEIPEIIADYEWLEELEIDNQKVKEIKNIPKNLKILSLLIII